MKHRSKGFTIVELLIVIVVIGILAAITIVAYNGIQNRAKNTAALSLARNVNRIVEINLVDRGNYPTITEMTDGTTLGKLNATSFTVSGATPSTESHVRYVQRGSPAIGAQITYRTFPTGTADIVLGTCS